ncbi:MAG TPA: SLATT domain-containing protein [Umezawaea sp.]|nr:SLATT domain-containing protein [Umezawaea sp.]
MSDAKTESTTPGKAGAPAKSEAPPPAKAGTTTPAKPGTAAPAKTTAKPEPAKTGSAPAKPEAPARTGSAPAKPEAAASSRTGAVQARLEAAPPAKAELAAPVKPSPKPRPKPQTKTVPVHSAEERRTQFLRVYLKHRVGERLDGFERARSKYTSSRRWTGALSVLLMAGAAALGAVAAADATRRPMWGFLAAVAASLAVAVAWYESAFGLRRLARRSTSGAALLEILQAHGAPSDEDGVAAFVTEVESVLRHSD